jgi:homogentisate 1,2-dioxygenase
VPGQGQTEPETEPDTEPNAERESSWLWTNKHMGQLFEARMQHSPFDVVAWHGKQYVLCSALPTILCCWCILAVLYCSLRD